MPIVKSLTNNMILESFWRPVEMKSGAKKYLMTISIFYISFCLLGKIGIKKLFWRLFLFVKYFSKGEAGRPTDCDDGFYVISSFSCIPLKIPSFLI